MPVLKILVLHPGALGDTILSLPALSFLRRLSDKTEVTFLGNSSLLPILLETGYADTAFRFDDPRWIWLFGGGVAPGSLPEIAVIWGGGDQVVGRLSKAGVAKVIGSAVLSSLAKAHRTDLFIDSLAPLGIVRPDPPQARIPDLRHFRAADPTRTVVVHPGAGSKKKRWKDFSSLIRLLSDRGLEPLLLEGPAEPGLAEEIAEESGVPVEIVAGVGLNEVAGLIGSAAAYIGNDSGVTHLAAAIGAPTAALCGSETDLARWEVRGETARSFDFSASLLMIADWISCYAAFFSRSRAAFFSFRDR